MSSSSVESRAPKTNPGEGKCKRE